MKIKDAISMIMFHVSVLASIAMFVIIGSVDDVSAGGIVLYLKLFLMLIFFISISVAFYDYRIYTRHIFAIYCMISAIYGCYTDKVTPRYKFLYRVFLTQRSVSKFYNYMLTFYDHHHLTTPVVHRCFARGLK